MAFGSLVVQHHIITKPKMFIDSLCPHFFNCLDMHTPHPPTFIAEALHLVTRVQPLKPLSEINGFYGISIAL